MNRTRSPSAWACCSSLCRKGALLGPPEKRAAHDQQLAAAVLHRGQRFQQFVDALVRLQPAAEQHDEILRRKAQRGPQPFVGGAGGEPAGVDAVVQDVGVVAVQAAGLEVLVPDKLAQRQDAPVDLVHRVAAAGQAVQVWPGRLAAEHRLMALHWVRVPPSATIRSGGGSSSASESWTFWYQGS